MSALQVACLTLYAFGMAIGQFFFKSAADKYAALGEPQAVGHFSRLLSIALDPLYLLAIALYAGITMFWVWILSFTPLSRAYPFGALALVFTALLGVFFFRESISRTHLFGLFLILSGMLVISRS